MRGTSTVLTPAAAASERASKAIRGFHLWIPSTRDLRRTGRLWRSPWFRQGREKSRQTRRIQFSLFYSILVSCIDDGRGRLRLLDRLASPLFSPLLISIKKKQATDRPAVGGLQGYRGEARLHVCHTRKPDWTTTTESPVSRLVGVEAHLER